MTLRWLPNSLEPSVPPWPNSPSTVMDSLVEGARETVSSMQRLARRASVSSISPGRDLPEGG